MQTSSCTLTIWGIDMTEIGRREFLVNAAVVTLATLNASEFEMGAEKAGG